MNHDPADISINAADCSPDEMYFLLRDSIIPRPIAWVSTMDEHGVTNLAPFSFFNICSPSPPIIGFSCLSKAGRSREQPFVAKDTLHNIRALREFVVNIVPEHLAEPMVRSSDPLPAHESEFAHAGLQAMPSTQVRPPRVAGAPVAFECRLYDALELGNSVWVMGEIVQVHIHPEVYLGARGGSQHRIDLLKKETTRPYARLGRDLYSRLRAIETLERRD